MKTNRKIVLVTRETLSKLNTQKTVKSLASSQTYLKRASSSGYVVNRNSKSPLTGGKPIKGGRKEEKKDSIEKSPAQAQDLILNLRVLSNLSNQLGSRYFSD